MTQLMFWHTGLNTCMMSGSKLKTFKHALHPWQERISFAELLLRIPKNCLSSKESF